MRKWGPILVVLFVSLMPVAAAQAQYNSSDGRTTTNTRANRGMIKLVIYGGILVIGGGVAVVKKMMGK